MKHVGEKIVMLIFSWLGILYAGLVLFGRFEQAFALILLAVCYSIANVVINELAEKSILIFSKK